MLGNSVFHKYQSFKNGGLTPDWTGRGLGSGFSAAGRGLFLPEESGVQLTQGAAAGWEVPAAGGTGLDSRQPAAELPQADLSAEPDALPKPGRRQKLPGG